MPSITVFCNFSTAPFASDDMHIVCLILGLYRAIQFICLLPLGVITFIGGSKGDYYINGVPPWCSNYYNGTFTDEEGYLPFFREQINLDYRTNPMATDLFSHAAAYFLIDVAWLIMVWSCASIGTPTEPGRRDVYIRNLIKFKVFFSNLYPMVLIGLGVTYVYWMRYDNYGCGQENTVDDRPDDGPWYGLFCTLIVTYALELLVWPAIAAKHVVRVLRINLFRNRSRLDGRGGKAERFEFMFGLFLKALSCVSRGKAGGKVRFGWKVCKTLVGYLIPLIAFVAKDLKNKGELQEFAHQVMCLLNNQTNLRLVFSDLYVGLRVLSRVQGERKFDAIKRLAKKNKFLRKGWMAGEVDQIGQSDFIQNQHRSSEQQSEADSELNPRVGRRHAGMLVLQMSDQTCQYELFEREVLQEWNDFDQRALLEGAHFCKYASFVYRKLPNCVASEFADDEEDECPGFRRESEDLFRDEFRLSSIGLDHAILCYSNFVNGIVATPYSIMVDTEMNKVVIAVRGTRSLEDIVVDLQFVPESMEKTGNVCGFNGDGHYCHKGFLARCKWIYNDLKKSEVLKTLYSEQSPYSNYSLVVCGHSLGAGCASILSLMLRASFPSVKCFAYEPPPIFDDAMSEACEEFIISFVRHDDLVPRLSYHNFETLRDEFFNTFARIKVPKLQLYYHLKIPYSERVAARRNAEVLRPLDKIRADTSFNKEVEKFRAERNIKNTAKSFAVLTIAGRIIHLVDTSGDENKEKYVPYWASRASFNQVELSKRCYSDHDIHSLVGIIRDIKLGADNDMSIAFNNASLTMIDGEDDEISVTDVRLFACRDNPYGKLPLLLFIVGLVAVGFAQGTVTTCNFLIASIPALKSAQTFFNGTMNVTFSFFEYEIIYCDNSTVPCHLYDDNDGHKQCVPYPPKWTVPGPITAGRAFYTIAYVGGTIAVFMILISVCFIIRQRTWKIITVLLLVVTLFQGLSFIFLKDFWWCSLPNFTCSLGPAAMYSIVACCLWFLMAIVTGYLGKVGKKEVARLEADVAEDREGPETTDSR